MNERNNLIASREVAREAITVAESILLHKKKSDPNRWLQKEIIKSEELNNFWWSDTIPLIEIPLYDSLKRAPDGYFLISGDQRLPPLLEYADTGAPLTHQVGSLCVPALRHADVDWKPSKYHYASSTELYLEFPPVDDVVHLLNVPNLTSMQVKDGIKVQRNPEDVFDQNLVASLWKIYTPGGPGDVPAIVLPFLTPVKYQQSCNKYGARNAECKIKITSSENYCAPNAIAGCVTVAWAMLMSAWKRSGFFGANSIWASSACWNLDWPSYGGYANPSQCALVESTIWKLHSLLATTKDGATNQSDTIRGAAIFSDYGLNWSFGQAFNQPFEFAIRVTQAGQPLLWTAQGNWVPGQPVAGHGVVSYGYQKSDRCLYVALGWGSSFSDKYIYYDQYSQNDCFFMTGHANATATSGEILSII